MKLITVTHQLAFKKQGPFYKVYNLILFKSVNKVDYMNSYLVLIYFFLDILY